MTNGRGPPWVGGTGGLMGIGPGRGIVYGGGGLCGLVQDVLRVQLVGALSGQVGSETLVGMAKRSVWTPLLSRSEGPRMRSCQQRPASGQGRFQLKAWRLLTSSRSGLILDCWGLNSLATVGLCRLCALMQKRAG